MFPKGDTLQEEDGLCYTFHCALFSILLPCEEVPSSLQKGKARRNRIRKACKMEENEGGAILQTEY